MCQKIRENEQRYFIRTEDKTSPSQVQTFLLAQPNMQVDSVWVWVTLDWNTSSKQLQFLLGLLHLLVGHRVCRQVCCDASFTLEHVVLAWSKTALFFLFFFVWFLNEHCGATIVAMTNAECIASICNHSSVAHHVASKKHSTQMRWQEGKEETNVLSCYLLMLGLLLQISDRYFSAIKNDAP